MPLYEPAVRLIAGNALVAAVQPFSAKQAGPLMLLSPDLFRDCKVA